MESAGKAEKRRKLLSVLVPAYNEAENLPSVYNRLTAILQPLEVELDYEVVVLDNASTDGTGDIARGFCLRDDRWRYLRYSRNFGVEASMLAGIDYAAGDAMITIFSDLQDPPELIPEFVRRWQEGNEVVTGILRKRSDQTFLKSLGAKIAYYLIQTLSDYRIPANATDFRLLDRKVICALRELREPDRYLRGLIHWVGFKRAEVPYDRAERTGGRSSAGLVHCIRFAINAMLCFSAKPLHLATACGAFVLLLSVVVTVISVADRLFDIPFIPAAPPGITTLVLLVSFLLGFNTVFLGILGEYLGRIYNQGKQRPLYIVDDAIHMTARTETVPPGNGGR